MWTSSPTGTLVKWKPMVLPPPSGTTFDFQKKCVERRATDSFLHQGLQRLSLWPFLSSLACEVRL